MEINLIYKGIDLEIEYEAYYEKEFIETWDFYGNWESYEVEYVVDDIDIIEITYLGKNREYKITNISDEKLKEIEVFIKCAI